jgi:predicted kinase
MTRHSGLLVLFGGPAGGGKSTLAAAWCATRERAVHLQLDQVRDLIVAGRADPQRPGTLQSEQFELSVAACCALARVFVEAGYDVAVDDVLPPPAFDAHWRPALEGIDWRVVIVIPSLDETLRRAGARDKRVPEEIIRRQHEASLLWPGRYRIDTTGLSVEEGVRLVDGLISQLAGA